MENNLYPFKFRPILKDKLWGGNKLKNILKKEGATDISGESWEISGVEGNVSEVSNGFLEGNTLEELIEIYMGDIVGDKVFEKFGNEFPLLIKFIDANDNLSIQVHPNDEVATERHNSFGKTEMWYIMEHEPNAELISGFKKTIDKDTYVKCLNDKKLTDILNYEKVKNGDVFFMPAGRVHAIGAGILLAEIQQTSDITYRIYDFDRLESNGKPRELHTEQALDVIDFKGYDNYKTNYAKKLNETIEVVECPYFQTNIIEFDKPLIRDYYILDSFVIYICDKGSFSIIYNDNERIQVTAGESVLIPASLYDITLEPSTKTTILEVYIK